MLGKYLGPSYLKRVEPECHLVPLGDGNEPDTLLVRAVVVGVVRGLQVAPFLGQLTTTHGWGGVLKNGYCTYVTEPGYICY